MQPNKTLADCPPVPQEMYETVAVLARSGQIPAERLAELLTDREFAEWFASTTQVETQDHDDSAD